MFDATAIVGEARALGLDHAEDTEVLPFLHARGLSIVQSAIVYAKLRGVSLNEAKEVLSESETSSDEFTRHAEFHISLTRAADEEAESG
jgi:hypothetical protein